MTENSSSAPRRQFRTRAGKVLNFSALGFGAASIGNMLRPLSEEHCDRTLAAAWDKGMRYFDTAPFYGLGLSEMRVGRTLARHPREDYVLGTKVGRVLIPCEKEEVNGIVFVDTPQVRFEYDYSYDGVMRSYEDSRKRLGIDRIDILYAHDICAFAHGGREGSEARIRELMDTGGWRALDELRSANQVAAIGAGVNDWEACVRLLELADPDLFLIAGRYTLLEQGPLETLFPQCAKRGVGIVAGGPYNTGLLAGGTTYNYMDAPPAVLALMRAINAVCLAHGVSLPAAAIQFILANPLVVSVIPGGQNVKETEHNAAVLNEPIPPALWQELKAKKLLHPSAPVPE